LGVGSLGIDEHHQSGRAQGDVAEIHD
jgi:hypothetical protein